VTYGKARELNVTRRIPGIAAPFTGALSRSAILRGDGNYRDDLNPVSMVMTMNGIAVAAGPGPAAQRRARGTRR
jgi:hypothetical protein